MGLVSTAIAIIIFRSGVLISCDHLSTGIVLRVLLEQFEEAVLIGEVSFRLEYLVYILHSFPLLAFLVRLFPHLLLI